MVQIDKIEWTILKKGEKKKKKYQSEKCCCAFLALNVLALHPKLRLWSIFFSSCNITYRLISITVEHFWWLARIKQLNLCFFFFVPSGEHKWIEMFLLRNWNTNERENIITFMSKQNSTCRFRWTIFPSH